jgi:hypothetical protein
MSYWLLFDVLQSFLRFFFLWHFYSVVNPHHLDADPDSTFHPDANPDPDPSFQLIAQLKPLKKCSNRLMVHTFCIVNC